MNLLPALAISLILNVGIGWAALHEYGTVRSDTANCNTLRTADAKAANDAAAAKVKAALDEADTQYQQILKSQVEADAKHEKVMLKIQHRQDTAAQHYKDASHDKAAVAWASQPVPTDYALGMCASLGNCPGRGGTAADTAIAQGRPKGPGTHGRDAPSSHAHRQPAADRDEALERSAKL